MEYHYNLDNDFEDDEIEDERLESLDSDSDDEMDIPDEVDVVDNSEDDEYRDGPLWPGGAADTASDMS